MCFKGYSVLFAWPQWILDPEVRFMLQSSSFHLKAKWLYDRVLRESIEDRNKQILFCIYKLPGIQ